MATKPGVTRRPSASTVRVACSPAQDPTAVIRPPSTAMSAVRGTAPVPSTTVPPRIRRSCMVRSPFGHPSGAPPSLARRLQRRNAGVRSGGLGPGSRAARLVGTPEVPVPPRSCRLSLRPGRDSLPPAAAETAELGPHDDETKRGSPVGDPDNSEIGGPEHAAAADMAARAGALLLELRAGGLEGKALGAEGGRRSHRLLTDLLGER